MYLFDFDGVLIDSAREAGLSAYNTVFKKEYTSLSQLPDGCEELFFKNIYHFYNPYTLCNLMKWCGEQASVTNDRMMSRSEFSEYCAAQKDIVQSEITPYFYSIRVRFMETNPKEWLELNRPFPKIWNYLQQSDPKQLFILTAKNKKAVHTLCHHYGLMIPETNIYAGDNGVSKTDNFNIIHERIHARAYHFIDDHLKNLKDLDAHCNKTGAFLSPESDAFMKLYLCDWGYGDTLDYEEARKRGYSVVSQEQFIEQIENAA